MKLRRRREYVLERLDDWDAAVFLTQQQRSEVDALIGPGANRHVIPHGRVVPESPPGVNRDTRRGVMLTSLKRRKQITHAIQAMARVKRAGVTLDVWGHGPEEELLKEAIAEQHAPVRLRGYSTEAWREFDRASFSLLTSSNEAFGLVLVESMGHGCIPISYDMPYGPADIITHGVDGFLVRRNNIRALARRIRRLAKARPEAVARMRVAAHRRALEFSDAHVTERWADLMAGLLATRRPT